MRTGAEIKLALAAFVKRWSGYGGTERAEAQTFLNDLFACYGADRKDVGAADDDYSMGILLSRAHDAWAWARSSTLKGDLRYTPSTVFMTSPSPTRSRRSHVPRWPRRRRPSTRDAPSCARSIRSG